MRKGQASTEYLIILAVVIIVALVAVAVLGGFIDIGAAGSEQAAKAYWRVADIGIVDWSVSGTSVTLVVQNNQDYKIKLNTLSLEGTNIISGLGGTISAGKTTSITTDAGPSCTSGSGYSYTVVIYYNDIEHSVNDKVFTGAQDIVGTC